MYWSNFSQNLDRSLIPTEEIVHLLSYTGSDALSFLNIYLIQMSINPILAKYYFIVLGCTFSFPETFSFLLHALTNFRRIKLFIEFVYALRAGGRGTSSNKVLMFLL